MNESWKRVETKTLLEHPRVTVVEDDVILPDGQETKYLRFNGLGDFVTIVALNEDKMAFLKEYAYPIDDWLWQLPEGMIDKGETPVEAGHRELREETGLVASELIELGAAYKYHRRSTQRGYVMYASSTRQDSKAAGDVEEQGTEFHWLPITEVQQMVRDGRITQGNTLAALAMYFVNFATKTTA